MGRPPHQRDRCSRRSTLLCLKHCLSVAHLLQTNICKKKFVILRCAMSEKLDSPRETTEPVSIVPDTTGLKALAHPERLRMLGLLRIDGPSTATALACRMGLNSGATSYHLRQLAKHGFIEPANDLGNRRDRWWRARHQTTVYDTSDKSGLALEAGLALSQAVVSQHMEFLQAALGEYATLPPPWRKVSTNNDVIVRVTADEARELHDRLMDLLRSFHARHPLGEGRVPDGTRNFMVLLHTFPFPDISGGQETDET